ncbi:MAG: M56 family metallopeptidase, partial [Lachnospiraceae bacterium]|nr:M56 family metallopeptidase [Lachnospiraceae bacterium]
MGVYVLLPVIAGMGATAGLAVIAVLIGRCLLKKGPKLFCYLLWSVVLFRLLCPVSVPSAVSVLRLFEFGRVRTASYLTAVSNGLKVQGNLQPPAGKVSQENKGRSGAEYFLMGDFMVGGASDLWLAWNGRFGMEHPAQEEIAGAADGLDILPPAPPMLFMEVGVPKEGAQEKTDTGKFYIENAYITGKTAGSSTVPG